jgi:chromate transporter
MVAVVWLMLWLAPVVLLLAFMGPQDVVAQLAVFFSQVALVSFAAALVPHESRIGDHGSGTA